MLKDIQEGDLVLKEVLEPVVEPSGKFRRKWWGSYIIKTITKADVEWIIDLDGNTFSRPVNLDRLKIFHH